MGAKTKTGRCRLNLALSEKAYDRLEKLEQSMELSKTAVIEQALIAIEAERTLRAYGMHQFPGGPISPPWPPEVTYQGGADE